MQLHPAISGPQQAAKALLVRMVMRKGESISAPTNWQYAEIGWTPGWRLGPAADEVRAGLS